MNVALYRKKPVVVEAIRYHAPGDEEYEHGNIREIEAFGVRVEPTEHWGDDHPNGRNIRIWVQANEAWIEIEPLSWVIKDASGFYPCLDERFTETYEPV